MSDTMLTGEMETNVRLAPSRRVYLLCALCMAVGVVALVVGFAVPASRLNAWLWLNIWFLFFGGAAQGMVLWAATFRVAQARWTPVVNRIGQSGICFLPAAYVVMLVLVLGARAWVPWVTHPVPEKQAWLNLPLMVFRNLVAMGLMGVLSLVMVRWSLREGAAVQRGRQLTEGEHHRLNVISLVVVFAYVFVYTLVSYDFIMSLSPRWYSTMFAPYYWVTNAYAGLAVIIIASAYLRLPLRVLRYLTPSEFNDMGNLMLGFSLFIMGLFFAQYLTIWMGNLPDETFFLTLRYYKGHPAAFWPYPSWFSFLLAYALPFVVLQSRELKHSPRWLSLVAAISLVGVALERYILVVPSVEPGKIVPAVLPVLSGLAFFGGLVLAIVLFMKRYPPVSEADEALRQFEPELEAITR